jgi:hypothetical protein
MTEKTLQGLVERCARLFSWRAYHTYDSRRSAPGFPDLILIRGERLVAVELKSERGRVTEAQLAWLMDLKRAGVEAFVWRPSDWLSGEVERVLRPAAPGKGAP